VKSRTRIALALTTALTLAACGTSPVPTYYSLSAATPAAAAATAAAGVRRVVIVSTTIPDSLDRPQITLRESWGRVSFAEYHRWSESLKSGIPRTVAAQLSQDLGGAEVWPSSQAAPADAEVRVLLDVTRFDSSLGEAAQIEVLWTVRRGTTERTGRTIAREQTTDASYGALVTAHAKALGAVSRDLAAAIRALPAAPAR